MAIDLFLCTLTKCKTVGAVNVTSFNEPQIVGLTKLTIEHSQPKVRRIAYLLSEHILPMVCKRDFGLKQEFEGKLSRVATNLECISRSSCVSSVQISKKMKLTIVHRKPQQYFKY